ncbi:MAG: hypothetical protein E6G61_11065, partial [Actinobacteria bacterium]
RIVGGVGAWHAEDPVWSPDGTLIAFVGNPSTPDYSPDDAVYVTRPDGSGIERLSNRDLDTYGVAGDIAWQPLLASESPTSTISPSISDPIQIESSPGAVSGVEYGFGSMWVSSFDKSQTGWITRLDTTTGEKVARISTGDVFPTWEIGGGGLTVGNGSLWLAGAAAAPGEVGGVHAFLLRIDPDTNAVVARIDLGTGSGADVVVDDSGVWALSLSVADDGTTAMLVTRVDASSNAVVATIPLDATYGHYIFAVQGSIVAQTNVVRQDTVAGTVLHIIDAATNTVETSVPLGTYAWPTADKTHLWALDGRTILSIDPATGRRGRRRRGRRVVPRSVPSGSPQPIRSGHRRGRRLGRARSRLDADRDGGGAREPLGPELRGDGHAGRLELNGPYTIRP